MSLPLVKSVYGSRARHEPRGPGRADPCGRSQEAWWWQLLRDWALVSVHLHPFVLQQEL